MQLDQQRRKLMTGTKPNNLAARMGRWSAAHWKTATFGWLALVVGAFAIGGAVGAKTSTRTPRDRASPAAWTGFSRLALSSPPARASSSRATRSARPIPRSSRDRGRRRGRFGTGRRPERAVAARPREQRPDRQSGRAAL